MKKVILALLLLMATISVSVGQLAFATTAEEQIVELAKQNEKVTDAKCVIYEGICIVAIQTEQFGSKSEYDQFVKELVETIKNEYQVERVFVTRNPKVMKQIEVLTQMTEQERDDAIKKLIEQELLHHKNRKLVFPKKTNA